MLQQFMILKYALNHTKFHNPEFIDLPQMSALNRCIAVESKNLTSNVPYSGNGAR